MRQFQILNIEFILRICAYIQRLLPFSRPRLESSNFVIQYYSWKGFALFYTVEMKPWGLPASSSTGKNVTSVLSIQSDVKPRVLAFIAGQPRGMCLHVQHVQRYPSFAKEKR